MLKVSVITVTKNCEDVVSSTIESVINQKYTNLEYIIVDGNSVDSTLSIIKKYENKISKIVSEPDKGIYDAMNKGMNLATGDYVIFLNAGDMFFNSNVISNVFSKKDILEKKPLIISGKIEFMFNNQPLGLVRPWDKGREGPGLPHVATFIERNLHQSNLYNTLFKYCGDYELWMRLKSKDLYDVCYVDDVVSFFDIGGVSLAGHNILQRNLEKLFINNVYGKRTTYLNVIGIILKSLIYQYLNSLLGRKNFIKFIRYFRLLRKRL